MRPVVLLLVLAAPAPAVDPGPRAKVELSPKGGVWTGQRVTLAVTLYTPDLFAGVPAFDVPPVPGTVVLPPAGSPAVGSEVIGGDSFTTQRHEFAVYAQWPGEVRIPAFPIRFETNAGFGKPTVKREVTTTAVSFEARTPPGAEKLGTVIAARNLKVTDEWEPDTKAVKEGDAFTRTLTVTADGVPGMVFPSFRLDAIDGLSAYPKEPAVNDHTERGALTGQRVETVTYVCGGSGTVIVPDRALTWFDLDSKRLKVVKLPGRTVEVAVAHEPEPPPSSNSHAPFANSGWGRVAAIVVAVVLGTALVVRLWPRWVQQRLARTESEVGYFARLRRACRTGDPHAVYVALLQWLDRFGPLSLDEFVALAKDPPLSDATANLRNQLYSRASPPIDRRETKSFFLRLQAVRSRLEDQCREVGDSRILPPLNPNR